MAQRLIALSQVRYHRFRTLMSCTRPRTRCDRQRVGIGAALDCSRTYIGKLGAEGVIQRQGDGFPLDQSRVAYLRYLRRERRQSPPQ